MTNGERISWRGLNRCYTGIIVGKHKGFAVVKIDGSRKSMLLSIDNMFNPKATDKAV